MKKEESISNGFETMSGDLIYVLLESQNEERENREDLFEGIMAKAFLKLINKNNPKIQKPRGSKADTHTHTPHL